LGRFPVQGELRRKGRADAAFPSHSSFARIGGKEKLLEAITAYCQKREGFDDIAALCAARKTASSPHTAERKREARVTIEFVYLMKSGPHFKIGRTNSVGRRSSELAIKIPVPPTNIHRIETDDPVGIEAYWHRRFADKRGQGEWFVLSPEDAKAFKRWKRIV
jgi:hypothetical protein